jgi:hypothetical protein
MNETQGTAFVTVKREDFVPVDRSRRSIRPLGHALRRRFSRDN